MSTEEYARRVVEAYARGIICSGEVFSQFADHITPETVDSYMGRRNDPEMSHLVPEQRCVPPRTLR